MRTYRLYFNAASTTNNMANVQILKGGRIKSIRFATLFDSTVDGSTAYLEVSAQAASQPTTNNTIGVIASQRKVCNVATSGAFNGESSQQVLVDCPIGTGEFIYLNSVISGTVTLTGDVFVDVQE